MLVVIALAVVITVLVVRPDSGGGATPTKTDSQFASAGDVGPVNIIVEDPTCAAWNRVGRDYANRLTAVNWGQRDETASINRWTAEQRTMYEAAGKAITSAADQMAPLAEQTPHRVMRELYEQFNAYATEFVGRIPSYEVADNNLVVVTDALGNGLNNICAAISYKSAATLAPLVSKPSPPAVVAPVGDAANPSRFLVASNSICSTWAAASSKFSDDTSAWLAIDAEIPASQWTSEQKAINDAVIPVMLANSDDLERLGRQSENPTLEDMAILAAQYQRAYAVALPTYTAPDGLLAQATTFIVKAVEWACKAVT